SFAEYKKGISFLLLKTKKYQRGILKKKRRINSFYRKDRSEYSISLIITGFLYLLCKLRKI
ncbi:hypothetical protein, partial [Bacillus altitudinis]|uniref:hypothetical protein n=1 Tax=Bacillus altitudinis TaxID=293387 RepID=UPI0005D3053D